MRRLCLLLLTLMLFLCACTAETGEKVHMPEDVVAREVYYAVQDGVVSGAALRSETRWLDPDMDPVQALLETILSEPLDPQLRSVIPEGTSLQGWNLHNGKLYVDFSQEYGSLSGVDLSLADYSIAMTMRQMENVHVVTITADGETMRARHTQAISSTDVLSDLYQEGASERTVVLYFPAKDGSGLQTELRTIIREEDESLAAAAAKELCRGPVADDLESVFADESELISVELRDRVCYMNLSKDFARTSGEEELFALVNTMGTLSGVREVQILWEGSVWEKWNDLYVGAPLRPQITIEKENR